MKFKSVSMQYWKWVTEKEHDAWKVEEQNTIPIVAPTDPKRRNEWEAILNWYASKISLTDSNFTDLLKVQAEANTQIVVTSKALYPAAIILAINTGRSCVLEADFAGNIHRYKKNRIVLVGEPSYFDAKTIGEFNKHADLTWSVIVGDDVSVVSFFIAKTLLYRLSRSNPIHWNKEILIIDAIDGELEFQLPSGEAESIPFEPEQIDRAISSSLHAMIVRAHGEGAHVNLNSTVLCSRRTPTEMDLNGLEIDGCKEENGKSICKRVWSDEISIQLIGQLQLAHFIFYSCNGYSVAGELFSSNLSCVLGLIEGYAVSSMCNDRPGHASLEDLRFAANYFDQTQSIDPLVAFENDRLLLTESERPWIQVGDFFPAIENQSYALQITKLERNEKKQNSIRGYDFTESDTIFSVFLGCQKGYFLHSSEVTLNDSTWENHLTDWNGTYQSLILLRKSCSRFQRQEQSILKVYTERIKSSSELSDLLSELTQIRVELEKACDEALYSLIELEKRKLLSSRTKPLLQLVKIILMTWEQQFLELSEKLLLKGSVEKLFGLGWRMNVYGLEQTCSRCALPLIKKEFTDPLMYLNNQIQIHCPTCGPVQAYSENACRLEITVCGTAKKGTAISLEAMVHRSDQHYLSNEGKLVLSIKDKGNQETFYNTTISLQANTAHFFEIVLPETLTSELHTLRALWTGEMEFSYLRNRISTVI